MTNYDILKEYEAHKTPVPTYDEYKAMQLRIENEKRLLDYNGELLNRLKETEETVKSLFQQIAGSSKTIEEMKEELAEHRHYCCCMENEVMRLDKAKLEEENKQLRGLLKECIYILNEYKHCFDVKHHNMTANIIDKANEVLK